MKRTTFLEHYRISVDPVGMPRELGRTGAAITYEAVDETSGDTVALKLISLASIDPALREQVEQQARTAQKLRHVNIAKVLDFGEDDGHFVYVSEYLPGETLASWVAAHGPMPADAVLRVAAQVVGALPVASFHKLTHRAIQPSNLMIVPGPTPEGGWPFVKLLNFGLAGLQLQSDEGDKHEESFSVAPGFASPEQLQNGTVDFRSEIYSLGATMYFLLTSAAPSAEMRRQQLRVFPKTLRNLLGHMLRHNPDQRPQDPAALTEMIGECLQRIERRQDLADRFGIPFMTRTPRTTERPQGRLLRRALVFGALLLTAAAVAAVLLPEPIGRILHRKHGLKEIGVLVGVPETSPPPEIQGALTAPISTAAPSQAANAAPNVADQPAGNAASPLANSNQDLEPQTLSGQTSNAGLASAATPGNPPDASTNTQTGPEEPAPVEDNSSAQSNVAPQPATTSQPTSVSKKKRLASTSKRARAARNSVYGRRRLPMGSMRARVVGATPDGRLIMRSSSGRVVIVTPDSADQGDILPRRDRRAFRERDEIFSSPPQYGPDYFPYD